MAALIGALRVTLGADTAAFHKGMTAAEKKAASSAGSIQRSLGGVKAAAAGMLAGLSLGALVTMGKQAIDFAGALTEVSKQTGTTVEQYQILTRAAMENGVEQGRLDAALKRLNQTLGEAQGGSEKAIKALGQLGIKPEQIASLQRGGDLIPMVADGIKSMATEAQAAAAANGVMGKSGSALLPILSQGSEGYNRMAAEALAAGLITTEQAERADAAGERIDRLAYSLKVNLVSAFLEVLPAIEAVITALSRIISTTSSAIAYLDELASRNGGPGLGGTLKRALLVNPIFGPFALLSMMEGAKPKKKGKAAVLPPRGTRTLDLSGPGKKPPRGARGKSAEQMAEEAERRRKELLRAEFDHASDRRRNEIEILRAQANLAENFAHQESIEREILNAEIEQAEAASRLAVGVGDLTQGQADELRIQQTRLNELKGQEITERYRGQRLEDERRTAENVAQIESERLEGLAELAETQAERRAIELEILAAAFRERKAALERAQLATDDLQEKARLQAQIDALPALQANAKTGVMRGTMGPLEAFMASLPNSAAKVNEAFEAVAANGLQSLVDGLGEAMAGARSMADVFKQVAKQIIADLARIAAQRVIMEALSAVLGTSFNSAGSVSKSSGSGGGLPKFAGGGSFLIQGRRGTDRNLLSLNGIGIARVSHGERMAISPDGANGGGAIVINQTFAPNLAGSAVDRGEMVWWMGQARQQTLAAVREARRRSG